ncbi:outer membrane beta-barrel protein [Persicirhabdus sediminis]|uniref:Outer membrane beta-barrel protein n=1 Tax=Persicirhabdus sediminis TaxID=454144 RepID=A0A8J7MGD7_9BACT|nr:outer membrane beta-barrel protein [Persicirhabdus sediminis]MBK1792293.1 outer membrane beta-barrel protein [Persicirhabdus sediminis]
MTSSVLAGENYSVSDDITIATAPPADQWEFSISPYLLMAGLEGTVGLGGQNIGVDAAFSDIADKLEIGGAAYFEARKGKWGFALDGLWLKLKGNADLPTPGPVLESSELTLETVRAKALAYYRFYDKQTTSIDAYGGISYNYVDTQLELNGLANIEQRNTEGWFDPVIGLRISHQLSEKWFLRAVGEVGGFGVSSDFNWEAMALLGYSINDCWDLGLAYRGIGIDYSEDDFVYDVTMSGPMLGVTYSW